ncbi:GNAT family N-acetyltransferase [Glaciihabitans sp. INWT7]|uniref:GNAT family N-acetyltransferase n=1 Tax=Glaciihabitans sp. INWT7 TaxID=2596912 RepID=UPI001626E731|nr:GNAT family N-acetyltransferase [Glaciihabitans sp. INWT7]
MTALYGSTMDHYPPEIARALSAAFAVDPETIVATILALCGEVPVGQAGLRPFPADSDDLAILEIKKVFIHESYRGRGISRALMLDLEAAGRELGSTTLILQTGTLQGAAIGLYESLGYVLTAPYPPFESMSNALCYAKAL